MKYLAFIIVFISSILTAQNTGGIIIKVADSETGNPIERVGVSIDGVKDIFLTNKFGTIEIEKLIAGKTSITLKHIAYEKYEVTVEVQENKLNELSIQLISRSLPLGEVTVTSTRGVERESPFTFSNIPEKELQKQNLTKDIPYILSTLPSTTIHSENGNSIGYSYLRIRGFDQRRISVLINGIPQNDPEDHNVYWINFFDLASSLQDIQVQRGAGGAFYGPPSIGGTINLLTKNFTNEPSYNLEAGYGSFNTQKISASFSSGVLNNHFIFSAKGTRVTTSGYRDWAWSRFWRYFVGMNYFDDYNNVKISFFGGPQEDGLAFYGIPKSANSDKELRKANLGSNLGDREYLNSPQVSLQHDYTISNSLLLHNSLFYFSGDGYFDFDGTWGSNDYFRIPASISIPSDLVMRASVDNDQFGWLPRLEYSHSSGRTIFGAEFRFHRSLHWGRIQSASGIPKQYVGDSDYRFYEYKGGKNIYSLYLNHLHKLSQSISLTADLRLLYQQYKIFDEKHVGTNFTTPYLFLLPKVGINYNYDDNFSFYGSFGLTRREPPLKNLYDAGSASWGVLPQFERDINGQFNFDKPMVKDEQLYDYEAGIRYSSQNIKLNANVYWMEFNNEIVKSGGLDVFGQPRVGNAEKTRHIGLELEAAYRVIKNIELMGNVNISRNRFVKFIEYDANSQPLNRSDNAIANAPELILNGGISYNYGYGNINLQVQHIGTQYADNSQRAGNNAEQSVTVDPFTVINFTGTVKVPAFSATNIQLLFEINNLLNKYYMMNAFGSDNFFVAAPRNYFLTVRISN